MQKSFRNREHSVIREIIGVIAFAAAVYLLIVILSYSKDDPSLSSFARQMTDISNKGGVVGAYIADALLQTIGLGAYLLVILLFLFSLRLVFIRDYKVRFIKTFSILALVLSVSSIVSLLFNDSLTFERGGYAVGGWTGDIIRATLIKYLNYPGAALVIFLSIIISIMIFENISFIPFLEKIASVIKSFFSGIKEYYIKRRERARKHKEITKRLKVRTQKPKITAMEEKVIEREKSEQEAFSFLTPSGTFTVPPLSILTSEHKRIKIDKESLLMNSRILEKKLSDYGVEGKVVEVHPGPVVTQYEYEPAPGVKVNKIVGLQDDLSMALRAISIRIVAPIPGKSVVGIEIPNNNRETVNFKDILEAESYTKSRSNLTLALGKDIAGNPFSTDLAKMPHLLIAGATGSGKSVGLNSMICSILFKASPDDVRFIMIDPKMLELITYEDIPHLLLPVVTDPKKASAALKWAVAEMERRYKVMSKKGVRNINSYNTKLAKEQAEKSKLKRSQTEEESGEGVKEEKHLPLIVIVIDELADLMCVASKDVEKSIARLAQMARAAGLHLIVATQRPSVDVLTGLIKANFPSRISFQVSARTDSRTILDSMGAEQLLGNGDMLFLPPGTSKVKRIHGAYISDSEINELVEFLKQQGVPDYDETIIENIQSSDDDAIMSEDNEYDAKYDQAVQFVSELGHASISLIQRRFKIGYNRAARIIEMMERDGIVGPSDGSRPREVLVNKI